MQVQVQSNTSTFPRTRAQSYQTCEYFKSPTKYFQYPHWINVYTGWFFYWSALKMTKCQTLRKF